MAKLFTNPVIEETAAEETETEILNETEPQETGKTKKKEVKSQKDCIQVVKFKNPIVWNGVEIKEVWVKQDMAAEDLVAAEDEMIMTLVAEGVILPPGTQNFHRMALHIIARMIDMPVEFVKKILVPDFRVLMNRAQPFLM